MCCKEGCCSCWTRINMPVLVIGMTISLMEVILASIVHYHTVGFWLGIIGLASTSTFCYYYYVERKEASNIVSHDDETSALMPEQDRKKMQQKQCVKKVFWLIYAIYLIFLGFMTLVRLFAVSSHKSWRDDVGDTIPATCGDWSVEMGCTYISNLESKCVRAGDIPSEFTVDFDASTTCEQLTSVISDCADSLPHFKINSDVKCDSVIHMTIESVFFGFIDDMYI